MVKSKKFQLVVTLSLADPADVAKIPTDVIRALGHMGVAGQATITLVSYEPVEVSDGTPVQAPVLN